MQNLIGLLLPPLIDLINRRVKDRDARFWISVGICALVGLFMTVVATSFYSGMTLVDGVEVTAINIMATYGLAQLSYGGVWKSSDTRKKLDLDATIRPHLD